MAESTRQQDAQSDTRDAATKAAEREKTTPPGEAPVKQHNPGDQGLNPGQRGPAQPSGTSDAGDAGGA
ncbi:hypothetical protein [Noviherbaspirillum sp. Root189]|uniref:hypothetical protein n=1 Tax=Noviherbaspirillum sp. Root189 TaxID=1736487 RepID=UPI0012E3AC3F|nr:hypothetical protein [Noviherbaspirillum sp. Root189]